MLDGSESLNCRKQRFNLRVGTFAPVNERAVRRMIRS
jgi:hypothetical protein